MKLKPFTTWNGAAGDESMATRGYRFFCLGCKSAHSFATFHGPAVPPRVTYEENAAGVVVEVKRPQPIWTFDGNEEAPTFNPSLHYQHSRGHWADCKWVQTGPLFTDCHLYVRAGRIDYLGDCAHSLRGRSFDLPEWRDTL